MASNAGRSSTWKDSVKKARVLAAVEELLRSLLWKANRSWLLEDLVMLGDFHAVEELELAITEAVCILRLDPSTGLLRAGGAAIQKKEKKN